MKVLEGVALHFLKREIAPKLQESRIQKVFFCSARHETWLELYAPWGRGFLVISCHPETSLMFLTPHRDAQVPRGEHTQWTQLLHKYLVGGKIVALEQEKWDRVLRVEIRNPSLWQEENELYLFLELTGRNANCILVKKDTHLTILGTYRRITPEKNRFRTILPGHPYTPPPQKEKVDPLAVMEGGVDIPLPSEAGESRQWVIDHIDGIGPFLGEVIAQGILISRANPALILSKLFEPLRQASPSVVVFSSSPYEPPQGIFWQNDLYFPETYFQSFSSWNEAVRTFYQRWWEYKERETQEKTKRRRIQEELDFIDKEIQEAKNLLQDNETLEETRMKGELLKLASGLEILEETEKGIRVKNPFTGGETFIPLNPALTRTQNMQHYFRLYRKGLNRNHKLREKLAELEKRRAKILQEAENLQKMFPSEPVVSPSPFRRFKTEQGSEIWVGKSQKSNHKLLQNASRDDYWLHVRDLPGAHVILKLSPQGNREEEIEKAAQLAGYFSAGKSEAKVEIIVTQVKYLRAIPRTMGKVTFRNEKTILVKPTWPRGVSVQEYEAK
jgi:predicted ribosome quality control (RQC) complex YloA/Tae2 family protein